MTVARKTWREELDTDPWKFDFLNLLWTLERSTPDKPRIGRSEVLAQEIARLHQDPFLEFPTANVTSFRQMKPGARADVGERFLGYFGPQGALPLATTIEAYHWLQGHDDSFSRFANLFADRFIQLFFRAWADARPIVQIARPEADRFRAWLGSAIGLGTPALEDRDSLPDVAKLAYAGIMGSRVKSATRLAQVLRGILGVELMIRERVASWLEFEPQDLTRIGQTGAALGQSTHLGARVQSINDKITVTIRTHSLEEYESYLPGRGRFRRIVDLIFFYMGELIDVDLALELPRSARPTAQLGTTGQIGWTAWSAPDTGETAADGDDYIVAATFAASPGRLAEVPDTAKAAPTPRTTPPPPGPEATADAESDAGEVPALEAATDPPPPEDAAPAGETGIASPDSLVGPGEADGPLDGARAKESLRKKKNSEKNNDKNDRDHQDD